MKVLASFVAATLASKSGWEANFDAPHCGCQIILDQESINKTCSINFKYPLTYSTDERNDPHFVSVASTYMVGRQRDSSTGSQFIFTGYDEVTNPTTLDILVFYEKDHCYAAGSGGHNINITAYPQEEVYKLYAMPEEQKEALCDYEINCVDSGFVPGVHLGNFNYDIARSVQTYTVPIYGLEKGKSASFTLKDYYDNDSNCMNPLAHSGHGTAFGCSTNTTCSNRITFQNNLGKMICLEIFVKIVFRSQRSPRVLSIRAGLPS